MTAVLALAAASCAGLPAVAPTCDDLEVLALEAQSVPSAGAVPCLADVPEGWTVSLFSAGDAGTRFALDHAIAGRETIVVDVAADCRTPDGDVRPGGVPAHVVDEGDSDADGYTGERLVPLDGGCAAIHLDLATEKWRDVLEEFDRIFTTVDRDLLADRLRDASDGVLRLDG